MRIVLLIAFTLLFNTVICSQTTYFNDSWSTGNPREQGRLKSVEIKPDGVVVTIEVKALKALKRLNIFSTYNTYILQNGEKALQLSGVITDRGVQACGSYSDIGWDNVPLGATRSYQLFFKGHLSSGISNFSMVDFGDNNGNHGYCFRNYTIDNKRRNYLDFGSIAEVKEHIDNNNDGICGIYEAVNNGGLNVACVKHKDEYKLIYMSSNDSYPNRSYWNIGDIKANMRITAAGIIKADWYLSDKSVSEAIIQMDGKSIELVNSNGETIFLKTYPLSSSNNGSSSNNAQQWTGTGFALKNGYIVTNNHVVEGASSILVQGVNGSTVEYKAEVVSVDNKNDLALIRITDHRFDGFGAIPYSVKETLCDVGSDVFVLGYPLTTYMGEEIKLTNGIISSRSGYQGDITTYQISAPVQPGNSGGPMFDKYGNIVGIVNAGIPGAENVGYAIKTTYLFNLINSAVSNAIIPQSNTISTKSLSEKVKVLRNYTFYIKCSQ